MQIPTHYVRQQPQTRQRCAVNRICTKVTKQSNKINRSYQAAELQFCSMAM